LNDIERVISRLENQRASIDRALSALRELDPAKPAVVVAAASVAVPSKPGPKPAVKKRKKSRLSAEGRQRIIDAAKKRWAEKKAAEASKSGSKKK
jgi:hypothetical protein